MPNLRPWEILIIVALIVLLFGAKRLPDAARGLGRSLRIFKAETKAMHDDDASTVDASDAAPDATPAIGQHTAASAPEQQKPSTTPAPERTET
jgi:sec-independent protein translocase protein TatA